MCSRSLSGSEPSASLFTRYMPIHKTLKIIQHCTYRQTSVCCITPARDTARITKSDRTAALGLLGAPNLYSKGYRGALSSGLRGQGRETGYTFTLGAQIKNAYLLPLTSLHIVSLIQHINEFNFILNESIH
jgi:hypothetical protein